MELELSELTIDRMKELMLEAHMTAARGRRNVAAASLGITRMTLNKWLRTTATGLRWLAEEEARKAAEAAQKLKERIESKAAKAREMDEESEDMASELMRLYPDTYPNIEKVMEVTGLTREQLMAGE